MRQNIITVDGNKVRALRRSRGMSQAALAADICTQATISQMEKKGKIPNLNTLLQVAQRLETDISNLIETRSSVMQPVFATVEKALKRHDYGGAHHLLVGISDKELANQQEVMEYHYLFGLCELLGLKRYEDAIYYFNRVLTLRDQKVIGSLTVLATLGIALAYVRQGHSDRCRIYLAEAETMTEQLDLDDTNHVDTLLALQLQGGQSAYLLGDYEKARALAEAGIERAVEGGRLYLLDDLYALRSQVMQALGEDNTADKEAARILSLVIAPRTKTQLSLAE